jgi:hypothetical protein
MPTRNVINVSDVEHFVDAFADQTDHPALKRWLSRNVRRWILKHYDRTDPVVRDPATGGLAIAGVDGALQPFDVAMPAWCAAAIARGDEVVRLRLGATLRKRVGRAVAALVAELEDGRLSDLDRITFPTAEAKARKRRRALYLAERKNRLAKAAIPVYRGSQGDTVVRLTTPECLADEGSRMSHCVATYDYWVKKGECEIYSVRDLDGKPRATVEVDQGGSVWQIKGFANGSVEPYYRLVLQDFIRNRGYPVDDDQDNLLFDMTVHSMEPRELVRVIVNPHFLAQLRANRFNGRALIRNADLGLLLRMVAVNAKHLPEEALTRLFFALKPNAGIYMRARRVAVFGVYGSAVSLYVVELPLPLLNQIWQRTFKGCTIESEANAFYRAAEAAVTRLALSAPDRLFALGPARPREPWEAILLESAADFLWRSPIDVTPLRAARHESLRRAMNQAKQRSAGRRAKPSAAHLAVRHLLDGSRRQYVL